MKSYTLLAAIVSLASMTVATPVPEPVPAPAPESVGLAKRNINSASCLWNWSSFQGYANIGIVASGDWMDGDGMGYFEQQYNNQCGASFVDSWKYTGSESNSYDISILLKAGFPDKCTENAIWLASYPSGAIEGVECIWSDNF